MYVPAAFLHEPPRPRKTRYLAILANALEKHHDNGVRFDLGCWFERRYDVDHNWCGSEACAVGLAMSIPEFNRKGLGIAGNCVQPALYKGPTISPFEKYKVIESGRTPIYPSERDANVSIGFASVMWFFGLSGMEVAWLFVGSAYDQPDDPEDYEPSSGDKAARAVAKRIRALLAGEPATPNTSIAKWATTNLCEAPLPMWD